MATPGNKSYSAPSGSIYAGRLKPTIPAWMLAAGLWATLPNSQFNTSGVGWSGTSPGGNGNYTAMVIQWSGAIVNTVGCYYAGAFHPGTYLHPWGGGHAAYAGQEMYAFGPMESDTPTFHRLTDPYIPGVVDSVDGARNASGYPVSRHTYDTLQYLPASNRMLAMLASATYNTPGSFLKGQLFDFATNTWIACDTGLPTSAGGSGTDNAQGGYNPTLGEAWLMLPGNANRFIKYTESTNTFSYVTKDNPGYRANSKGAVDPVHNLLMQLGSTSSTLLVHDLSNPANPIVSPGCTGTGPTSGNWNLDWAPTLGCFVSWDNSGTAVFFLTPPATNPLSNTWTWTSAPGTGGVTPGNATGAGVYGRGRVVTISGVSGYLMMPAENTPACFYRF